MSDKKIVGSAQPNVPDSAKYACGGCGADVWLARSGQRVVRDEGAVPTCTKCVELAIAAAGESIEVQVPSREQLLEDLGITGRN